MTPIRNLALFALLGAATSAAHADPITISAVASTPLGPSADTFSLDSSSSSMAPVVSQSGTFNVGDSGNLVGTFSFSFIDNVTIDGTTEALSLYGQDDVTLAADTLSIFASGPIPIGDATWSLRPFTITAGNIQPYAVQLIADVAPSSTPEPAGLFLLGTGALVTAFSIRRRLFSL